MRISDWSSDVCSSDLSAAASTCSSRAKATSSPSNATFAKHRKGIFMFGRLHDACICIMLGILILGMAEDIAQIPGNAIYAFMSVMTAAGAFGTADFEMGRASCREREYKYV